MELKIPVKLHNRFDVVKFNPMTGEETPLAYAENIILDQFWSTYLGSAFFNNIHLGSGTGTLSASRTSLFTHVTTKAVDATTSGKDVANGYAYYRRRITITETENVGTTFREVGIANSSTTTHLLTHALLKDMNGNPTSILKTSLDILRIYATLYLVFPSTPAYGGRLRMAWDLSADFTAADGLIARLCGGGSFYIASQTPVFTEMGGPAIVYSHSSFLTSNIEGYTYTPSLTNIVAPAWDRPNKRWRGTWRLPAATGNAAPEGFYGITFLWDSGGNTWHIFCGMDLHDGAALFDGSVITGESLGTGNGVLTDFKTAYGKIKEGATVKIDGVAATGYTIERNKPKTTSLKAYLRNVKQTPGPGGAGALGSYPGLYGWNPMYYYDYSAGSGVIVEHLLYQECDFISFQGYAGLKVSASDDLNTWELVTSSGSQGTSLITYNIGAAYRRKRYFKIEYTNAYANYYSMRITAPLTNVSDFNNVHFSTPPGLVTAEAVGTGDGSDTTFTLAHVPIGGSLTVKLDGVTTTDYTLNNAEITFNTAPGIGVAITADYKYSCAVTIDYTTEAMVKNNNYVLDVTLTLQFGEYTP